MLSSLRTPRQAAVRSVIRIEKLVIPFYSSFPRRQSTLSSSQYVGAIAELSKYRLSALVVSTSSAGFFAYGAIAVPATNYSLSSLAMCCIGTALCSSSASTLNQIFEQDRDKRMKRTKNRPLPSGRMNTKEASMFASISGISGASLLYVLDPTTCLLGVSNLALYSGLYTYLKPRSESNTWVGAVVGAVPPLMGWTAAGGSVCDAEAWMLGGALYLWQMPHFFALSWMYRQDYARGGFEMVSVNDNEHGDRTSGLITRYTCYLATLPILSTLADMTSSMFALEGIVLNGFALKAAYNFHRDRSNANARKVFLTSLWYLPCWMMLFILHSKPWEEDSKVEDSKVKQLLAAIRQKGKDNCLHEVVTMNMIQAGESSVEDKCPLIFGKEQIAHGKALESAETIAGCTKNSISANTNTGV